MTYDNIIDTIQKDHDYIRRIHHLYKQETQPTEKQKYANELIKSIAVHSVAEEIVVYPVLQSRLAHGQETASQSRQEHLEVKQALYELDHMQVHDPGFDTKLDRTMSLLKEHMQHEEKNILPELQRASWDQELLDLSQQFQRTKTTVPTHPHPSAPDQPPMETLVGMLQAPIDKMFDYVARQFPTTKT